MAGELNLPAQETPINNTNNNSGNSRVGAVADLTVGQKRQRRPSVRLGDIGDKPNNYSRSMTLHHRSKPSSSAKTRPLTNLINNNNNGGGGGGNGNHNDFSSTSAAAETTAINKKHRTNLRIEPNSDERENNDFDHPQQFHEQQHDEDSGGDDGEEEEEEEGEEFTDGEREADGWEHKGGGGSSSRSIRVSGLDDGVRKWLVGLGLGRYAPVFEIHEVDDEVLPQLTLEDLKDMGINAVGSRRKLYSAIVNLRKATTTSS